MMRRRAMLFALLCTVFASHAAFADGFSSQRISVEARGAGRDVILIPGLSSSPRVWAELVKAVPGHRYHLVHIAGFAGRPTGGNADGPVAAPVAAEIARYIKAEGLDKPAVVGHSMGGSIAMMLAARHPKDVSKLMVVDMLPFLGAMFGPPGTTSESIRPMADARLADTRAATPQARQKRSEAMLTGMIDSVAMRAGAIEDSLASDADVSARAFHELIVTDLTPELGKIGVPAKVLYVMPKGLPLTLAQLDGLYRGAYAPLAQLELTRIDGGAHFIMWDQPERFQQEVRSFLK